MDFTTVIAVDKKHFDQLSTTWPNWIKYKPSLLDHPLLVIVDDLGLIEKLDRVLSDHKMIRYFPWYPKCEYEQKTDERWYDPQRQKMLASFVFAAKQIKTDFWLKIDCDTISKPVDDWINSEWFDDTPAIIASGWGYTKPPMQMVELDNWADENEIPGLSDRPRLDLYPKPGSDLVRHQRIISWCGFFNTDFTRWCAKIAEDHCGYGQLPVPSQDGFMWWAATRSGWLVRRENLKYAWIHRSTMKGIREAIEEVDSSVQNP